MHMLVLDLVAMTVVFGTMMITSEGGERYPTSFHLKSPFLSGFFRPLQCILHARN